WLAAVSPSLLLAAEPAAVHSGVDSSAVRAHAEFLADDTLRGRDTGSAEYAIAARYAATRLASWGLAPGNGKSFFQPVHFAEAKVEHPRLAGRRGGRKIELTPTSEFILFGSVASEKSRIAADVVFVGYGIDAPELGRRDYEGIDVRRKVVLMVKGAPSSFPSDQRAHYSSTRLKAEFAEKHGAVGILVVRDREEEQRIPWQRVQAYADHPRTAWVDDDGSIHDAFPGLALSALLSREGATKLLEGSGLGFDALLDSLTAPDQHSRALALRLEATCENRMKRIESPNVAAILQGSDPTLRDEYIVVSAHLDHVGVGRAIAGDTIYNGFYDNAIGSAILLETARVLAMAPERPRRSVIFLLVTGEERGLLGSDYFAHHPTVHVDQLVANVNVDMPLLLTPAADLVAFGAEHSSLGPLAKTAAAAHGFELIPDPMPQEVIFVRSDQYSFVRQGVPAIYLTAGSGTVGGGDAQAKASGEFLAQHYHQPSDEVELGADWDSAARFTAAQADLVRAIANATDRPAWNAGDFFGEKFGKR
ncbi:MAG: M28 family metallopeptidase, partial [Thermoanaerobaculia bacterium]